MVMDQEWERESVIRGRMFKVGVPFETFYYQFFTRSLTSSPATSRHNATNFDVLKFVSKTREFDLFCEFAPFW